MHVRLARRSDAEPIRVIYNAEVVGSATATFDLVPRTPEEQDRWLAEHRGPYPAVVAVDEDEVVLGFGSLSAYRDRPSYATTVENSVYVAASHRAVRPAPPKTGGFGYRVLAEATATRGARSDGAATAPGAPTWPGERSGPQ